MDQKIPLQLTAKDTSLDVFFTGSENIGSYIGIDGVEPLDAYLDDPAQTEASYDFADIAPAVQAACQNGGQNWCIASKTGGAVLYYNTRMFEEAGITAPPTSPAELLDYAKRLTNDDHAGFCTRGDKTQNLYTAFMLWQWFYAYDNDVTGNYFDKDWNFLLSKDPSATEFATWYRDITQNASPDGIATYLVTNCLQDFQQGRVAMWHDDSGMIGEVLDPAKSRVSEETAFTALPCQPVNPDHCSLVQPFGIWMNRASEHKGAAWQFMQWITSPEVQAEDGHGRRAAHAVAAQGPRGSGRRGRDAGDLRRDPVDRPRAAERRAPAVHPRRGGHPAADAQRSVRAQRHGSTHR